jgi:hypothetical protein
MPTEDQIFVCLCRRSRTCLTSKILVFVVHILSFVKNVNFFLIIRAAMKMCHTFQINS